jgi:Uncharacterized conserved protein
MKRYTLTSYENASPEAQSVYDDYMRTTGDSSIPIWLQSLGHNENLLKGYWERAKRTLFYGNLPLPLKEMILFVVSAKNGARYCSACHAQCVLHLDKTISFQNLQSMVKSDPNYQMPEYYRCIIEFVSKVAENALSVEDADFEKLMDEGFTSEEIFEVISVIDLATMFNVFTNTLRMDLDPNYRAIL